jgi:hypothetical protein
MVDLSALRHKLLALDEDLLVGRRGFQLFLEALVGLELLQTRRGLIADVLALVIRGQIRIGLLRDERVVRFGGFRALQLLGGVRANALREVLRLGRRVALAFQILLELL